MEAVATSDNVVQYCGFRLGQNLYAIEVLKVQEVIRPQQVSKIPLSKEYVRGLINLRGQIVTALSLRKLFQVSGDDHSEEHMNIIIRGRDDTLLALMVDEILDVVNVDTTKVDQTPDTIPENLREYIKWVYKEEESLFLLVNLETLVEF